jgi:CBS domain-containing protein
MGGITGRGVEALQHPIDASPLREVVRVVSDESIKEVARTVREENVSSLLVGDQPQKIVTEQDLSRALADGLGPHDPVTAIAECAPLWVVTNSPVVDVAHMILRHEVRNRVVLKASGEAVGVVSMRDLFAMLVRLVCGPSRTQSL